MFLVNTRNFPPELGGIQVLMGGLSTALLNYGPVKIFAEKHKKSDIYDKNFRYDITRVSGIKLFRKFRKAFLIQYPSKGIWVIAFQSGDYRGEAESIIGEETINLFVPTTPNPTSGFFLMMAKKDAFELDMSVEEAFKLVISAGVVTPNSVKIKDEK